MQRIFMTVLFVLIAFSTQAATAKKSKKNAEKPGATAVSSDSSVKKDTTVKKDSTVKKDTSSAKDTLAKDTLKKAQPLLDSAKSLVDSALAMASRNKPTDLKDCVEMDPANPIVGRKFDQVNMVLGRDIGKLMSRYLELNRKNKDLKGKLLIDFIIDKAGKVTDVKFKANTLNNKELEDKVMAVVSAAVFPSAGALDVNSVIVHYPIYFFPW